MDTAPLTLFARKVSTNGRLLFADLRRLQRDILPNGIATREEAEILLSLDHLGRLDQAWLPYLVDAVTTFVSAEAPNLETDTRAWLVQVLQSAQPKTAAAIVWALAREGCPLGEDLAPFARRSGKRLRDAQDETGTAASSAAP
jgi:hypothetical protein